MATLLLRLCAPMQAWGTQSHFTHRETGREPSKSGVIGLLCAALGISRNDNDRLLELSQLRMGVRVDQEGVIRRDYQTAGMGGIYKVSGGVKKSLVTSDRFYLADAKFLVGLEGDTQWLDTIHQAVQTPKWFLFLGRKTFIPAERVWLPEGVLETSLEDTLHNYPWLGKGQPPKKLRVVLEDATGSMTRFDQPLSFKQRRFLPRRMTQHYIAIPPLSEDVIDGD